MEAAAVARGEAIDFHRFGHLVDRLGRALQRLGLKRVPKDVTPDMRTYIRGSRA
jgi:hypothetical protein